jgi:hypothetical protein
MLQVKTGDTSALSLMGEVSSSSIDTSLLYFATNTQKGQAEEVKDMMNRIFADIVSRVSVPPENILKFYSLHP